jgi:DUF4097 and DUF4098 domain-containing protein YvlB
MTERRGQEQKKQRRLAISHALVVGVVSAIILICGVAQASDQGKLTEEFHKVYPFSARGRIQVENLNGAVHISGWDRDEVKVDAVKSAWTKERLDEAKIEVNAEQNEISIRTEFLSHDQTFVGHDHNNPANVEYTITLPRQARLDEIKLINGRLDVQGVVGEVHASCVNGRIEAHNLQGPVKLNTVNGELDAIVDQLPASDLRLSSVNGRLRLTLPSDVNAELKASTLSGNISDDFGLPVIRHQFIGHSLHGQLGGGGTLINLSNVNGAIEIRHASDNRPLSPVQNLEREQDRHDDESKDDEDEN